MIGCDWAGLVDAQWDSRSYILPPGVKDIFFLKKHFFSLTQSYIPSYFAIIPPLKKMWPFISPLHKDTLCQVWFKLSQWFRIRRFSKVVHIFSLCCYYLPLEKGKNPSFERNWILFIQGCSVRAMFSWNWPGGSGEDNMCEQIWIDTWTDRQTINYRCLAKLTWAP